MSQHGGYDQALLDEAPVATRAQRQEGYNVDLLDTRPSRPLSTQPLSPPLEPIPHHDTDVESSPQEKFAPAAVMYAQKPTQPFWRTRNGKITILVVVVLVLGAVIGGAVGGAVGKKSSNTNSNPPPSSSTSGTTSLSTRLPGITSSPNITSSSGTPALPETTSSTGTTFVPSTSTSVTSGGVAPNSGQGGATSTSSSASPTGSGSTTAPISGGNLAEDSS